MKYKKTLDSVLGPPFMILVVAGFFTSIYWLGRLTCGIFDTGRGACGDDPVGHTFVGILSSVVLGLAAWPFFVWAGSVRKAIREDREEIIRSAQAEHNQGQVSVAGARGEVSVAEPLAQPGDDDES